MRGRRRRDTRQENVTEGGTRSAAYTVPTLGLGAASGGVGGRRARSERRRAAGGWVKGVGEGRGRGRRSEHGEAPKTVPTELY